MRDAASLEEGEGYEQMLKGRAVDEERVGERSKDEKKRNTDVRTGGKD